MYGEVGQLLSDVLYGVFNHDLTPRKHLIATALKALKKSPMTIIQMAKLAVAAVRAL
jgi:electron transfer flavoprotein-quinone oxidoreductase